MQNVLAFVDFSDVTSSVLDTACEMARVFHGKLDVIHVAMPDSEMEGGEFRPDASRDGTAQEIRRIHRELEMVQKRLRARGADATALLVRSTSLRSDPVGKILEEMEQRKPDLVVMGTHGHGAVYHLVVGSASDAVVRRACCPVMLVPSRKDRDRRQQAVAGCKEGEGA